MTETAPRMPYLADAAAIELEDLGPLEEATGDPMRASGVTLWQDGEEEARVWEGTPGPSYWKLQTNEFVHTLARRLAVTPDGRAPQEGGPGDTPGFPRGGSGPPRIHEPIRQVHA